MASGQKRCTITGDRYNTAPMEYLLVGRRATAARHLPGFTKKYTQTPSGAAKKILVLLFAEEKWILATSNSIWSDEMVARHRNPPSALLPALFRSLEAR